MKQNMQIAFILLTLAVLPVAWAASIVGSKHDLSTSNYYGAYPGATTEICVFCHTPHGGNDGVVTGPIWNRKLTDSGSFTLYGGSTGTPNNASIICLSCHDGVSSVGDSSAVDPYDTHNIINNPGPGHATTPATPNCRACHPSGGVMPSTIWRIGADLSDDHPVSVSYALAKLNPDFGLKDTPTGGIKLFNGMVECASCHDVHNPQNGTFLRVSNDGSGLCKTCHEK